MPSSLNYKIIYRLNTNVYRLNSDIDKITWKPYINSFVRLPSIVSSHINSTSYEQLFLLTIGVYDLTSFLSPQPAPPTSQPAPLPPLTTKQPPPPAPSLTSSPKH